MPAPAITNDVKPNASSQPDSSPCPGIAEATVGLSVSLRHGTVRYSAMSPPNEQVRRGAEAGSISRAPNPSQRVANAALGIPVADAEPAEVQSRSRFPHIAFDRVTVRRSLTRFARQTICAVGSMRDLEESTGMTPRYRG